MHVFNPMELNLSEHLSLLERAGINIFRVEGRLKSPEWIGSVLKQYKNALNGQNPVFENVDVFPGGYTKGHFFRGVK